jgi:hypothetical protein
MVMALGEAGTDALAVTLIPPDPYEGGEEDQAPLAS